MAGGGGEPEAAGAGEFGGREAVRSRRLTCLEWRSCFHFGDEMPYICFKGVFYSRLISLNFHLFLQRDRSFWWLCRTVGVWWALRQHDLIQECSSQDSLFQRNRNTYILSIYSVLVGVKTPSEDSVENAWVSLSCWCIRPRVHLDKLFLSRN